MTPRARRALPPAAVLRERLPGWLLQALLLAAVGWLVWRGLDNFLGHARTRGISLGFGFLQREAGFEISQALLPFGPGATYGRAIAVALLNTLLVIALAGAASTVVAVVVAFGRLSAHPLVRGACTAYVEVFRNIPLLLQIFFWYFSAIALLPGVRQGFSLGGVLLNNRGLFLPRPVAGDHAGWALVASVVLLLAGVFALRAWRRRARPGLMAGALGLVGVVLLAMLPLALVPGGFTLELPSAAGFNVEGGLALLPELLALTLGLSIYNSTFLAEIFRAGILSVPRGQSEAAATVGLDGARAALLIVLPQALRLALPPAAGQYQTLAKASSLAAAIGYPDFMQIVGGTVLSQTNQALEAMALVVLFYAVVNLVIALLVNLVNRRLLRGQAH